MQEASGSEHIGPTARCDCMIAMSGGTLFGFARNPPFFFSFLTLWFHCSTIPSLCKLHRWKHLLYVMQRIGLVGLLAATLDLCCMFWRWLAHVFLGRERPFSRGRNPVVSVYRLANSAFTWRRGLFSRCISLVRCSIFWNCESFHTNMFFCSPYFQRVTNSCFQLSTSTFWLTVFCVLARGHHDPHRCGANRVPISMSGLDGEY